MTVLVTGYKGFIGSALRETLLDEKKSFFSYDIEDGPLNEDHLMKLDFDTIYHIGAVAGIEACEKDKSYAFKNNVESVQRWAEIALKKDARLVFTSSAAASRVSCNWYGLTKKIAEDILIYYQQAHGLKTTIIRLPNIYGPGSFHKDSVVAKMCKDALWNKAIYVHGDGKQTRQFLYINGVIKLLKNFDRLGFYRVANGKVCTINHLAQEIAEMFEVPVYHVDMKDTMSPFYNPSKNPHDISCELTINFQDGLEETAKDLSFNFAPKTEKHLRQLPLGLENEQLDPANHTD